MKFLSASLLHDPTGLPRPADPDAAARGRERWIDAGGRAEDAGFAEFAHAVADHRPGAALLDAVFGNSPFLGKCLLAEPPFTHVLFRDGPDVALDTTLSAIAADAPPASTTDAIMAALRRARLRVALVTGIADIAGAWPVEKVTEALSAFADIALQASTAHLLHWAHAAGDLALPHPDDPERESGLVVLGMGKLGAGELNYSSDIDLIILYDHERVTYTGRESPQQCFVRMARALIRILDERTRDGYVFRTDLRLRPDPGSTPPAISILAAETYYESTGQNWERAALIKARPVAGDRQAGARFLEFLRPFLWRKYLDFAAIQDIHSIKRQINAQRGGAEIRVLGHNIKLGRGGIREIEFFAQTQQLVWGGRDPRVREPATCAALRALAAAGHIGDEAADELIGAYRFLRKIEHRLQMVDDRQTHDLPQTETGLAALAAFSGFPDTAAFQDVLVHELRTVERYYAGLFEAAPDLGGPGSLVFTGSDDHPDTIRTLERLGYREPSSVAAVVRAWHHGRFRATRSSRAKELLTELMPVLLQAFARSVDPDAALMRFNDFLAGLPAGVQLFTLFHANPGLLDLLAEIMGSAPRLAETLRRHPILFDAVLTADFFAPLPDAPVLAVEMAESLGEARDFQDVLDVLRRRTSDRVFQIGVHMLRHHVGPGEVGGALSDVADTALGALFPAVEAELANHHGRMPGGGMALVALGKLGGRELTIGSDLDLLLVYANPEGVATSDGPRPLPVIQYFTRLGQRFLSAVTAPTAEGKLYEMDMRLRPSGNAGPIATSLEAFARYQRESAWTWEHMALTRARIVYAPDFLAAPLAAAIRDILTAPRDGEALLSDVADMRQRMARELGGGDIWDIKHLRGGLIDIEFIAQYLQLRHAHEVPEVLAPNTTDALARLGDAGLIDRATAGELIAAMGLWRNLQGILRLGFGDGFSEDGAPADSRNLVARACGTESFDALKQKIAATAGRVHAIFETLIEGPAVALDEAPAPQARD